MSNQLTSAMRKRASIAIVLFLISGALTISIKPYKITCDHDQEQVEYFNCSLRPINRTRSTFNLIGQVKGSYDKVFIKIKLFKKESVSFQPFLLDTVEDFCKYMKTGSGIYIPMLFPSIKKASNLNHTCPYSGLVHLKDFMLDPQDVPLPLPNGNYKLRIAAVGKLGGREIGGVSVHAFTGDDKFSAL